LTELINVRKEIKEISIISTDQIFDATPEIRRPG